MSNVFEILEERGFIEQMTHEKEIKELFERERIPFYIGFDPTADSLHVGHFATLLLASRLQKAGHKPYILVGGGTALVGDPSGRSDMRPMMTKEQVQHNVDYIKKQCEKFVSFDGENGAVIVNNADWLANLNYIDFIREVGTNLSVNKMLSYECFKQRYERGLSFLEFNYMPMQAYDFYHLFKTHGVRLEVGGDDQWANMLEGADLIRRKLQQPAFAMTFPLLTKADGSKMGKSAGGAIWLDENRTSPVDMYQFFRNVDDSLVEQELKMFTYLPLEEIKELTQYKDERINKAKEILAYEIVKIVHGEDVANQTKEKVKASFSGDSENMVNVDANSDEIKTTLDVITKFGEAKSNGEARRLIDGRAIKINDRVIDNYFDEIPERKDGSFVFHKGKKLHIKVNVK